MIHSKPHRTRLAVLLVACAVLPLTLAPAPASAQSDSRVQLELAAFVLFDSDVDVEGEALRTTYRFADRFQLAGRLSHYEISSFDVWILDASLQYFFDNRGSARWYVAGGPGTAYDDLDSFGDNGLLLHLGLGTEIDLTPNVYLRPEALVRWDVDDSDTVVGDVSLGIGWRF